MSVAREEMSTLTKLAVPIVLANVGTMTMGMVDLMMIGQLGDPRGMAAVAVANTWVWGTLMFAMGLLFGMDPIITKAHGARAKRPEESERRLGLTLQQGLVLAVPISIGVMFLWTVVGSFLGLAGQNPGTIEVGVEYTRAQIFSVAPFLAFIVLRQQLQGRGVLIPIFVVIVAANFMNVLFNWMFIFGRLGFEARGVEGAGIATGLTRVVMLVGLVMFIRWGKLLKEAWVPWTREAWSKSGLADILRYGIPTAFQMSLEIWAFGCATLMAGQLGDTAASAHSIVLNIAAVAFMFPQGISYAACTRVGNLIGAEEERRARTAGRVAFAMGAGIMAVSALILITTGQAIPSLFFDGTAADADQVLAQAAAILPIAAAFQVFDGTQVVGCGILRGQGQTLPAAAINLVGYWVLALPIGYWMAFHGGYELRGVWWGLALALALVAIALLWWVERRGPGSPRAYSPATEG